MQAKGRSFLASKLLAGGGDMAHGMTMEKSATAGSVFPSMDGSGESKSRYMHECAG
jgi:hypothetical protein